MAPRKAWKFPVRRRRLLLTAQRRRVMPPAKTLRALGLARGMCFLDVGCGPGYFAVPACGVVGKYGRVLACDVSPVMLREVRAGARARGYANLTARRCEGCLIPFPDAVADFALLAFVAHGVADLRALFGELRRALRRTGTLVAVEWHKRQMDMGPPHDARLAPAELTAELREAGFQEPRWWDFDGNTYFASAQAG